ncbi:MAG TPA: hypothetical protein VHB68_20025, partial [Steroidobacteraceae bacterium]|nr:hypothetical protein [Steroidobacteraceae bacterium]
SRDKKEQSDFAVRPIPKGRELTSPAAADSIAGSLSALSLDDVHKLNAPADAKYAHAIFRTFDGLELDVAGRKDGTHDLVTFTAHSTAKETADEAQRLSAQFQGWEYEIPSYKYDTIFRTIDDLLKPVETPKKAEKSKKGAADKTATAPAGAH